MRTLLRTTVSYDSDKPYLSLPVDSDGIDTITLERRYAGWYATLYSLDDNGIPWEYTPDRWIRYRNIYMLEYHNGSDYFELRIKEHSDSAKLTVYLGVQKEHDDGTHNEATA
mgnify:CR=1 FL=1